MGDMGDIGDIGDMSDMTFGYERPRMAGPARSRPVELALCGYFEAQLGVGIDSHPLRKHLHHVLGVQAQRVDPARRFRVNHLADRGGARNQRLAHQRGAAGVLEEAEREPLGGLALHHRPPATAPGAAGPVSWDRRAGALEAPIAEEVEEAKQEEETVWRRTIGRRVRGVAARLRAV
eukprot:306534-Prorocentrum_minimum.AAC.1